LHEGAEKRYRDAALSINLFEETEGLSGVILPLEKDKRDIYF
jgi:hypothetical protein